MAFGTEDDGDVDALRRAARRCGLPRQRRSRRTGGYHAGYYSAFVLDPDGNSIELVNHNR